jgi:peptidoglycan biosynthesis protein MviN/MurJ (putative lipid II flippase)
VIEPATLMLLLRQGPFSMRLGVLALALSVALSWTCARADGLAGAAVGSVAAIYLEHVGTLWRISRCTGVPWRHLQDWRSLGLLLLCAALAGVISWALVSRVPAELGLEARVAAGSVLLAVAYLALIVMCGLAPDWRAASEGLRRTP